MKERNINKGIKGRELEIFLQTLRVATVSSQDSCSLWPLWLKFSEGTVSQEAPQWLRTKQGQQRTWSQSSWITTPLFTATALPNISMLMQELTWKCSGFVWFICFEASISWARCRCYFRWDFLQRKGRIPLLLSSLFLSHCSNAIDSCR